MGAGRNLLLLVDQLLCVVPVCRHENDADSTQRAEKGLRKTYWCGLIVNIQAVQRWLDVFQSFRHHNVNTGLCKNGSCLTKMANMRRRCHVTWG